MKVAVIGLGVIGKVHLQVLEECGENVVAVCDAAACKLGAYPQYRGFVDWREMLAVARPDAVHVCTPHFLHAEMVIAALEAGINVLCEKPLCISRVEIESILEAEKKTDAMLGVVLQNRYNSANAYVKNLLRGNTVSCASASVAWHRDAAYYASGDWRGKRATEGGGVLINQAIHTLDLLQWFCGMPEKVTAECSNLSLGGVIEVEDTVSAVYSGGGDFSLFATNASARDMPVRISLCTDVGNIEVMPDAVAENGKLTRFDAARVLGKGCYGSGHEALIADFYDCLRTRRPFPIDGEQGAKSVRLVLAAYESGGKAVQIR